MKKNILLTIGVNNKRVTFIIILVSFIFYNSNAQIINTIAGNGIMGFWGDGGLATVSELNSPAGVIVDDSNNVYISDNSNFRIREVTSTGIINSIAGNGAKGFSGDGGPAIAAELYWPYQLALDKAGNIYIADCGNSRIRKITISTGIINTVAGNGSVGYNGDGIEATKAKLGYPTGVAVDDSGNIYIADQINCRVRKVQASTNIIYTVAGNGFGGFSGDGGVSISAELNFPVSVAIDSSRNIYIADSYNNRVRMVNVSTGIISTVAGNGIAGFSGDDGQATSAEVDTIFGIAIDEDRNLFIADQNNQRIRMVNGYNRIISTIAGNGTAGFNGDGIIATSAEINYPLNVALDISGNLFIADYSNNRIRKVMAPLGIKNLTTSKNINVYPVPSNGKIYLSLDGNGFSILNIFDELGRQIYVSNLDSNMQNQILNINLSDFNNGIYVLQIISNKGTISKKVILQK
jgi:sugar lactone lactonase YvrE